MATSPEVYVDTSAFIAFTDGSDTHHPLFARLFATRALGFLALVEMLAPLVIVSVTAKEITAATKLMRRFSDQDLTLADAVGLHLMGVRKTKSCWSTDRHLRLTGIPLVIDHA